MIRRTCISTFLLALLLAATPVLAAGVSNTGGDGLRPGELFIGVGISFDGDDDANPASVAFLHDDANAALIGAGDVILEYQGVPVSTGAELAAAVELLGPRTTGDAVELVVERAATGDVEEVTLFAVAVAVADPEVTCTTTTHVDKECQSRMSGQKKYCVCATVENTELTCERTICKITLGTTITQTKSNCHDGVNICNGDWFDAT